MTEITREQAQAIAAFLHALRPDWDEPGILAALGKARAKSEPGPLAIAAIRAACDPINRTPAVIGMDGRHWRDPEPEPAQRHELYSPPSSREACPRHPGRFAEGCGLCRVERFGEDEAPTGGREAYLAARAALRGEGK